MTKEEAQIKSGYVIPDDWAFIPVGEQAFFIVKGNEIHCWRDESVSGRWISRKDIEGVTEPLMREYGYVCTSVEHGNPQGQKFVQRLGFEESFKSPTHTYYVSRRMAHLRMKESICYES